MEAGEPTNGTEKIVRKLRLLSPNLGIVIRSNRLVVSGDAFAIKDLKESLEVLGSSLKIVISPEYETQAIIPLKRANRSSLFYKNCGIIKLLI